MMMTMTMVMGLHLISKSEICQEQSSEMKGEEQGFLSLLTYYILDSLNLKKKEVS